MRAASLRPSPALRKLAAERVAATSSRASRRSQFECRADGHRVRAAASIASTARIRKIGLHSRRVAALSHWSPGSLPDDAGQTIRETVFWTPPELTPPDDEDEINSSLCHGFIFDFCGVEIDPHHA